MARRQTFGGRLTDEARDGWDRKLARHNLTATGLLEALGELLAVGDDWVPESAIERARVIDRARLSRR